MRLTVYTQLEPLWNHRHGMTPEVTADVSVLVQAGYHHPPDACVEPPRGQLGEPNAKTPRGQLGTLSVGRAHEPSSNVI